jgi:hypothetical protein
LQPILTTTGPDTAIFEISACEIATAARPPSEQLATIFLRCPAIREAARQHVLHCPTSACHGCLIQQLETVQRAYNATRCSSTSTFVVKSKLFNTDSSKSAVDVVCDLLHRLDAAQYHHTPRAGHQIVPFTRLVTIMKSSLETGAPDHVPRIGDCDDKVSAMFDRCAPSLNVYVWALQTGMTLFAVIDEGGTVHTEHGYPRQYSKNELVL